MSRGSFTLRVGAVTGVCEQRHGLAAAAGLLALLTAACAVVPYPPLLLTTDELPADAFARCHDLLIARFGRLLVTDAAAFHLRTDWAPLPDREIAGQHRATLFREPDGLGVVVEARYLDKGWFGKLPAWTSPRPDARLEHELAELLGEALRSHDSPLDGSST